MNDQMRKRSSPRVSLGPGLSPRGVPRGLAGTGLAPGISLASRRGLPDWLCRCLLALPGCGCKARVCVLSPAVPVQRDFRIGRDIGEKSRPVGGHSGQQTSLVTLGVEGATTILVGVGGCLAREAAASGLGVGFSIKADK